ncbi:tyrosine-type recombinase/integrase [Profundibacter sp.]
MAGSAIAGIKPRRILMAFWWIFRCIQSYRRRLKPSRKIFLHTKQGKFRSPDGFGNAMRKWCNEASLPLCSAHGLRKSICRRLAEAGCTPHEIMSISGHITLPMAQKYCAQFGRRDLSDPAMLKFQNGPIAEQNLTNHSLRFVNKPSNQLKEMVNERVW